MKNIGNILLAFVAIFILATIPAGLIAPDHMYEVAAILAVLDVLAFITFTLKYGNESVAYNTLTLTKIFMKEITKDFYKDNGFITRSKNDTAFVKNGKTVHLPQKGGAPTIVKDLNSFPAPITKRVDTEATYDLHTLYLLPIHIEEVEEMEISYDKRASVREDAEMAIRQSAAQYILEDWMLDSVGATFVTDGSDRPAGYPTATGNRKAVTRNNFVMMAEAFDKEDLPQAGRNIMVPASMLADIRKIDEFMSAEKIGTANLIEGQIGRVFGMDIFTRSSLVPYKTDRTKVASNNKGQYGITAATVKDSALAWHSSMVRQALGSVKIDVHEKAPGMYGAVIDGTLRFGGRRSYENNKGVYVLLEG